MGSSGKKKASSTDVVTVDTDEWKKQIVSMLKGAKQEGKGNDNNDDGDEAVVMGRLPLKKLRRMVFLSILKHDEDDDDDDDNDGNENQRKVAKKTFKKTVQLLETEGIVSLNADGVITLLRHDKDDDDKKKKKKKRKEEKEEKKKKKKRQRTNEEEGEDDGDANAESKKMKKTKKHADDDDGDEDDDDKEDDNHRNDDNDANINDNTTTDTPKNKNKPCPGNPQGITRLFLGNLPFAIDDKGLEAFFAPAIVTHIQWITDKATGKFYGSAFVEMDTSVSAAHAVSMAGSSLSGRPIKINFAPARSGDVWPPPTKIVTGGSTPAGTSGSGGDNNSNKKPQRGDDALKPMSEKPEGCHKLFMGNLSYEIDDDKIKAFFASVDAEVKAVRWIHHKDTGDFKGVYVFYGCVICVAVICADDDDDDTVKSSHHTHSLSFFCNRGFVEFWNTEACDKAATLNGKNLLGRKIRIDWSDWGIDRSD